MSGFGMLRMLLWVVGCKFKNLGSEYVGMVLI